VNAPGGLAALQLALTAHLRDPGGAAPPPGLDSARLAVHARLLLQNLVTLLGSGFPVLRAVLGDAPWRALVRDFLAEHRSRTPLYHQLPQEFARYLAQGRRARNDPPWLAELADYEWLELEVAQAPEELPPPSASAADPLDTAPVPNPLARARCYTHPVHTIAPGRLPGPAATWLVVLRRRDDAVTFFELNAVSARLFELIARRPGVPARTLLADIARELAHPAPPRLLETGRALLREFRKRELLLE
jgi:hypothetical protein